MEENITTSLEFMRKERFERIKNKFDRVSSEANEIISKANDNDILRLALTFNSPIEVVEAEIFDEDKFVDLAF